MPTAQSEGPGNTTDNRASPPASEANETGQFKETDEDLAFFDEWLKEDAPSGIPDFIRPEAYNPKTPRRNGEGSENFRHRRRMFVNHNFSSSSKQSGCAQLAEDVVVGGFGKSWDTPIMGKSPRPTVYIADKETELSLRPRHARDNTNVTECPHLVIHTSCHCSKDCVYGVCTVCFLIFCDSDCLKAGLGSHGKVAESSKNYLECQFGRPAKVTKTPQQTKSHIGKFGLNNPQVFKSKSGPWISSEGGFQKERSDVNSRPFGQSAVTNQKAKVTNSQPQESSVAAKNASLPSTSANCNSNRSSEPKPSSSAFKKPETEKPSGIFKPALGFQQGFKPATPPKKSSPAPKNPTESVRGEPGTSSKSDSNEEFCGSPRGRGRGSKTKLFMPGHPRTGGNTRANPSQPERHESYLNPGTQHRSEKSMRDDQFSIPREQLRITNLCPEGKILRDPFSIQIINSNLVDREEPPPPFRGNTRRERERALRAEEEDNCIARVDSNVQVRLIKPLMGVHEGRSSGVGGGGGVDEPVLPKLHALPEEEDIGTALKKFLRIKKTAASSSTEESHTPHLTSTEGENSVAISSSDSSSELLKIAILKGKHPAVHPKVNPSNNSTSSSSSALAKQPQHFKAEVIPTEDPVIPRPSQPIDNEIDVPLGVNTVMKGTHVENVHRIFLTWAGAPKYVDPRKLNKVKLTPKIRANVGDYCVVHHEGDILNPNGRYRGQVMFISDDKAQVQLIDIGPVIQLPLADLFSLPEEFYNQRRLAISFGLKGVDPKGYTVLDYEALQFMEKIFGIEKYIVVCVTYVTTKENRSTTYSNHWGHLIIDDGDVAEILEKRRMADERRDKERFKDTNLYTSVSSVDKVLQRRHLNCTEHFTARILQGAQGLDQFSVMKECEDELLIKVEQLLKRSLSLGLNAYSPWTHGTGSMCAIEHKKEDKWYRGKVLLINNNLEAEVLLVDTGEEQVTPMRELKEMPGPLKEIVALAFRAELPLEPASYESEEWEWSPEIMRRFYRLNDIGGEHGLVAWVLTTNEIQNTYVIDFKMMLQSTTWATALIALNEAVFSEDLDPDVIAMIQDAVTGDRQLRILAMQDDIEESRAFWMNLPPKPLPAEEERSEPEEEENIPTVNDSEFHYGRIQKLQKLKDMQGKVFLFNRLIGYNVVTLIEKDETFKQYNELKDVITEWVKTGKADRTSDQVPKQHDVVLAPFSKGMYQRAKVEEIPLDANPPSVFVRFLEHSIVVRFPVADLKFPCKKIMEYPMMYHVAKIDEVDEDVPILLDQFQKLRMELEKCAIMGGEVKGASSSKSFPTVTLFVDGAFPLKRLATRINELAVWQWQKLYRGMYLNFEELSKAYKESIMDVRKFMLDKLIADSLKRTSFELKIQSVMHSDDKVYICGIPLDASLLYQSRTIQTQMTMFMDRVDSNEMTFEEVTNCSNMVGVKLHDEKRYKLMTEKFKTICTWHRSYFNFSDKSLTCLDCCWKVESENDVFLGATVRPLCHDFYDACPVAMTCEVDVTFLETGVVNGIAKKCFPRGKTINVTLKTSQPIYEMGMAFYPAVVPGFTKAFELGELKGLALDNEDD